jgi:hypothetical protein
MRVIRRRCACWEGQPRPGQGLPRSEHFFGAEPLGDERPGELGVLFLFRVPSVTGILLVVVGHCVGRLGGRRWGWSRSR